MQYFTNIIKIVSASLLIIFITFLSLPFNNSSEDHVIVPAKYFGEVTIIGSFPDINISIYRKVYTDSNGELNIYNVPLPYKNSNYTLLIYYRGNYGFCAKKLEFSRDYVLQNLKEENGRLVFEIGDIVLDQIITAKVEGYVKGYDGKSVSNAIVWIDAFPKFNDTVHYEYWLSDAYITDEKGYFVLHLPLNCYTYPSNPVSWNVTIGAVVVPLLIYSNFTQIDPWKTENRYVGTEMVLDNIDLRKDIKINITLGKSAVIFGRVIDKDKLPVKNLWIYAGRLYEYNYTYINGYAIYRNHTTGIPTDSNGRFVMFTNLKQGVIYLATGHLDSDVSVLIASNRTILDLGDISINLKFGYIKYDFSDLYSNVSIYDIFPTSFRFYHRNENLLKLLEDKPDEFWNYYKYYYNSHVVGIPKPYYLKNIDPYLIPVPAGKIRVLVNPLFVDQYLPGICYVQNTEKEIEYCEKIYRISLLSRLVYESIVGAAIIKPPPFKSSLKVAGLFNFNAYQYSSLQENFNKTSFVYIEGFKPYSTLVNVTEGQITVIKPVFERIKAPAYFDIKGRILLKIPSEMAITTVTTTSFYTTTEIITTTQTVTRTETETYITISTKTIFYTTTVSSSGTDNLSYFIVIAILLTALLFLMFYRKKRGP